MIELGLLILVAMAGVFWLMAALIGAAFKLTFGLLGVMFGGVFALFGIGVAALVLLPLLAIMLIPLLIPALGLALLIWLIIHLTRGSAPEQISRQP